MTIRDQLKAERSVGLGRVAPKISERGSSADDEGRRFASHVFDRSIKATSRSSKRSLSHPTTSGKARSRKPEVSRVTSLRRRKGPRRSTRPVVSTKDADYENVFRENFKPATLDTRDRGGSRDPRQFPRSITWPHTRQRISGNLTFRESPLSHPT